MNASGDITAALCHAVIKFNSVGAGYNGVSHPAETKVYRLLGLASMHCYPPITESASCLLNWPAVGTPPIFHGVTIIVGAERSILYIFPDS